MTVGEAIDLDIPSDVLDQLNQIIDESNDAAEAANGSFDAEDGSDEDEAGQRGQVRDEADEDQRIAAGKGQAAEPEDDLDAADQDTAALSADDDEPDGAGVDDEADPELAHLRDELSELKAWRENMLAQARENEERQIEAQTRQQAEAQYNAFMAQLEDMDPVDAEKAKTALVMNFAASLLQQNQAQTYAQQEQEQRRAAVDFIKNGGRMVRNESGQWVKNPTAAKPLTEDEAADLELMDHPQKMESYADRAIQRRTQRTVKARQVLAERRKAAGEGQVGGAGGARGGTAPEPDDPTTLEEWWALQESTYGGTPEALLQRSMGLRRSG